LKCFRKPDHKNGLILIRLHPELCRIKKKGATQLPGTDIFKNWMLLDPVTPYIELAALQNFWGLKGRGPKKKKIGGKSI
jgi:hypothetical protein